MGKKSRDKGKRGERQAAALVAKLFYPNGEGKVFKTPQSGAWGALTVLSGDLVCIKDDKIDENIPFFWEVKNVGAKVLSPFEIMAGNFGTIVDWLETAEGKAAGGSFPVILWHSFRTEWFITMTWSTFDEARHVYGRPPKTGVYLTRAKGVIFGRKFGVVQIPFWAFSEWVSKGKKET